MLSALGTTLGVLLAWLGIATLQAAAPPGIPRLEAIALDLPSLAVAACCSVVALVGFSVAPLGGARRRQLVDRLRAGSEHAGDRRVRHSTRRALIAAQSAGAAILVVLAVMLTQSFVKLMSFDLGWDATGVLSLRVPPMPPELRLPWYRYVEWSDRLIARLEATPGVSAPRSPRRSADTEYVPGELGERARTDRRQR